MEARASELPRIGEANWFPSTPARLLDQAARRPDAPAYAFHSGNGWITRNWADYARETRQAARALIALGCARDDSVAILGFNRREWTIAAHAAMMAGGRPAGIYWTSAPPEIAYILQHSEAPVLLVETMEQARDALALKDGCPALRHIVVMDGEGEGGLILSWDRFMSLGDDVQLDETVDGRLAAIEENQVGSLIYTSGTTGPPKAVMLTHGNLSWSASAIREMFGGRPGDRLLSYLPLAHIAEQQASVHNHVNGGGCLYFARSMETLGEDLKTARPNIFFGVPRVWEKMADTLKARLGEATGTKARLARWAMATASDHNAAVVAGRSPSPALEAKMALARKLVLSKVKKALGLDEARVLISGAAPISVDVLRFFASLDLLIYEGYGQSETSAPTSFNAPGQVRFGSVGKIIPHMEWRLSEEGELLVRGPNVFAGYMKNNDATADAFTREGWMRTGDIVSVDDDGFVFITGRIKDIIITSGGKNITPANLETELMDIDLVEHAVVAGDNRPYLVALLTLNAEALSAFARKHGIGADPESHPKVREAIQSGVDKVNARYARVENIRKFAILDAPLTVQGGDLTPTMKVKRRVVIERSQAAFDALFA